MSVFWLILPCRSPPNMQFHPWLMGMRDALEMMLTGDALSGIEAAEKGFAN